MSDKYTPTTDEIRLAWWMTPDNPADNEGASDLSFDRWLSAHDAEVARQQAERDAQIAASVTGVPMHAQWGPTIATAIRAQFG